MTLPSGKKSAFYPDCNLAEFLHGFLPPKNTPLVRKFKPDLVLKQIKSESMQRNASLILLI